MRQPYRRARINLKLLVLLGVVLSVGASGLVVAHTIRKRTIARNALAAAQKALDAGEWEEAGRQFRTYLSRFPDNPEILSKYARAELSIRPSRPDTISAAISAYRRLLRLNAGEKDLCERLATLYYGMGEYAEARYVAEQRLASDSKDVSAMAWIGKALLAQRKNGELEERLGRFVEERDPTAVPVYLLLSESVLQSGSGGADKALTWLDRAVKHSPQSAEALGRRARLYLLPGVIKDPKREEKARADLENADRLNPDSVEVRLLLADQWLELKESIRAQSEVETAKRLPLAPHARFDFEREEAKLALLRTSARLALLRQDKNEAIALVEQGEKELTQTRRTQFLPIATQLYVLLGKVPEARTCLEAYHAKADDGARSNKPLLEQLTLLDAQLANAEGQPYAALSRLEELVSVADPEDPTIWRELGYGYIRTGQDRRAGAALEKYLAVRPGDFSVTADLARLHYRNADWPNVLKYAQLAMDIPPEVHQSDLALRLILLEAILKGGRGSRPGDAEMEDISTQLQTLRQTRPRSVEVRLLQALILHHQKGADAAAAELRLAATETDNPLAATLQLIETLVSRNKRDEAMEACRLGIRQAPQAAAPRTRLAELQAAAGQKDQARRTLEEASAELEGDEAARSRLALAACLLTADQREQAIGLLGKLAVERPGDIEPRGRLLDLAEIQKNDKKAQELLRRKPVGDKPSDLAQDLVDEVRKIERERGLRWRYEQARVLMRDPSWKSRQQEVLDLLTRVVEGDSAWPAGVLLLAGAYDALNKDQQAEDVYRRFVDNHPNNVLVVSCYLELLERHGHYAQASQLLDRLPDLPAYVGHQTTVWIGQRRFDEAIKGLEKQVSEHPKDATSRVLLARLVYQQSGDLPRAMTLLDEAQKLVPELLSAVSTRVLLLKVAGRKDEAIAALNAEVKRRNDFAVYALRAEYHRSEGNLTEAEKDYQHLATFPGTIADAYTRLGTFYERTRQNEKAVGAYEAGLGADPGNHSLKGLLARSLLNSPAADAKQQGQKLLDELMKASPQDPFLLTVQAEALLAAGTLDSRQRAMVTFEKVIQIEPQSIQAHLQLIRFATAQGDTAKASQLAARGIGANPDSTELLLVRAMLEGDMGNYVSARESRNVLQRDQNSIAARTLLTELSLQLNDLKEAEEQTAFILKRLPDHEDARLAQATIAKLKGHPEEAIRFLETFRELPKGRASLKAAINLAELFRSRKDFARCEALLQEVEKTAPEVFSVLVIRLQYLAEEGRFDEFHKLVSARLSAHPAEAQVLLTAATILSEVNAAAELERAKPLFTRFIEQNPSNLNGYLAMAVLDYRTLDMKGAQDAYLQVLKLDPYHLKALNNLAWILSEEMGRHDDALVYANTGVLRYPADPNLLNSRGVILFKQNKLSEAKLDLNKCLELQNTTPGTRARSLACLGRIALREGDPRQARTLLGQALAIDQKLKVLTVQERAEIEKLVGPPATRAEAG